MEATRVEIFRDGLWRKLRLQDGKAIKYNALINRIGKIGSREISHTNTFALLAVFQNTDALGINIFNKTNLAKALNSKFPARYYIEDKLLQEGFLIINNTSDGIINVNFIDKALELTEKWGATTFKELLSDITVNIPEDYRLAILEMTNYDMSKTKVLTPLSEVGTRGYNLAIFPNALNAIGDKFQQPINTERLDNTFNPYQSRPIFNARALFDLACESYGYTPFYDTSINWEKVKDTFMIDEGLDQNKVADEGQVKITYPVVGSNPAYRYDGRKGSGSKFTMFNFIAGERISRPIDIPNWVNPPGGDDWGGANLSGGTGYKYQHCLLSPEITSATFGEIKYKADPYRANGDSRSTIFYAAWENVNWAIGGNVLFTSLEVTDEVDENGHYEGTIQKTQLRYPPANSTGKLFGVIGVYKKRFHTRNNFFKSYGLSNITVTENYLLENVVSYDENGQYIANAINLQHATPNKTIKELMSAIMQKEGILLNINSKTKTVKFFSYSAYRTKKELGDFEDWSSYYQEYVSPLFNTEYGDAYAKKNEIGLSEPYLGNTYDFLLENQGEDSKYKDFTKATVELFKDVEDIKRINNTVAPYYEYQNTGLGLIEKTGILAGLTQVTSNGSEQGSIPGLQLVANVNYAELPSGVREWYNLVDRAIRGSSTFLLPVDVVSSLDISKPIYIEGLGGFFIIEEVEEYVDASTPVLVKLIKLIEQDGDIIPRDNVIELIGNYSGASQYSAQLIKLSPGTEMIGSYSGSSTYTATLFYDFPDKELVGTYAGSSTYLATLIKSISLKQMEGSYSGSSSYFGQLIKEAKKFLLRTTDFFTGILTVVGEIFVTEKIHTPEIVIGDGSVTWNPTYNTVQVLSGFGNLLKLGKDTTFLIHNATGGTLLKGDVIYPTGASTLGVSNVDKAIANSHETIKSLLGTVAEDILDGADGEVMVKGILDPLDTSLLSEGPAYLSTTIAGKLTSIRPEFPNYAVLVGVVDSSSINGSFTTDISFNLSDTFNNFWNGTIRESFRFIVSSNGTTITGTLQDSVTGFLTLIFSDGFTSLAVPSAITLPAGTDEEPLLVYTYIPRSTKVLTTSISGYPLNEEYIKISKVIVQSALVVQSDGALSVDSENNEVQSSTTNQGHMSHLTERLGEESAKYSSGCDYVNTVSANSNKITITSGIIYQTHKQTYLAKDMLIGDSAYIINHFTTPYLKTADLNSLLNDALGNSLSNSSFSFVVWGIVSSGGQDSKLMVNLPTGAYAKSAPATALSDPDNYSVFTIPREYNGTGFLIARFTYVRQANGDWSLYASQDLRGSTVGSYGGNIGGGGGVSTFSALTDTPLEYATFANWLVRVAPSEAGLEYVEPKTNLFLNVGENGVDKYLDELDLGVTVQPYSSFVAYKNVDNNFSAIQTAPNFISSNLATQNNHLVRLDQLNSAISGIRWNDSVDDFFDPTLGLPISPSTGDRYISEATANGWIVNNVYEWIVNQWVETLAEEGMSLSVYSFDTNYTFNGVSWVEFGTTSSHNNLTGLQGGTVAQYYHLTATQHSNLIAVDTANIAYKNQANTFTQDQTISANLKVSGSVKMGDDVTIASASNVGTQRYRATASASYVDMCMQTGVSTYVWINIVRNEW